MLPPCETVPLTLEIDGAAEEFPAYAKIPSMIININFN
jgi:hypothetical protein